MSQQQVMGQHADSIRKLLFELLDCELPQQVHDTVS